MRIAILGASGYIGRALLGGRVSNPLTAVVGYTRDVELTKRTLSKYKIVFGDIKSYDELLDHEYDVVINATGIGSPRLLNENPSAVFLVTEEMDRVVFDYLDKYPKVRFFNLSSGAVYGKTVGDYITIDSLATFAVNELNEKDGYAIAKLHSEAKHRARQKSAIIDLRVFAFISRWLDTKETFFIAEAIKRLLEGEVFSTRSDDMVRDYCTADDLWKVIEFLCDKPAQNAAFDMQSKSPVAKFELLDRLSLKFGLKYEVSKELLEQSPTGAKSIYCAQSNALSKLGYQPEKTSLENIEAEISALLKSKNN